jgi:hypothetical protein
LVGGGGYQRDAICGRSQGQSSDHLCCP